MLVEAEGAGRVPPQLGWQGPAGRVRLLVRAPPPHPSPCSPGSASGALPWPGGRGQPRAGLALPGRRLHRGTPGAEGSQVSRNRDCAMRSIPQWLPITPNHVQAPWPSTLHACQSFSLSSTHYAWPEPSSPTAHTSGHLLSMFLSLECLLSLAYLFSRLQHKDPSSRKPFLPSQGLL